MPAALRTFSERWHGILVSFGRSGVAMSHEWIGGGEARDYVAYLLRLWRETSGGSSRWRASLQDPHSGERIGFASLTELFGYLRREIGGPPERDQSGLNNEGESA
jgi:hypothetical protein